MADLRLRDLRANQVPFWYQTFLREDDEYDEDGNPGNSQNGEDCTGY